MKISKNLLIIALNVLFYSNMFAQITAPDSLTYDEGVTINDVTWATRNVGEKGTFAEKPESAGMLYQWNKNVAWNNTSTTHEDWDDSPAIGNTWAKENDPSPEGWRVPTMEELQLLLDPEKVEHKWTTINGINGRMFIDKASKDSIFFPAVGYRDKTGKLKLVNSYGDYWSITEQKNKEKNAGYLIVTDLINTSTYSDKAIALSIRPVKIEHAGGRRNPKKIVIEVEDTIIPPPPPNCPECLPCPKTEVEKEIRDAEIAKRDPKCPKCEECPPLEIIIELGGDIPPTPPIDGDTIQLPTPLTPPDSDTPLPLPPGHDYTPQPMPNDGVITPPSPTNADTPCEDVEGVVIAGIKWATRNVGASGSFVKNPEDAGEFYNAEEAKTVCPKGWRLPTREELEILRQTKKTWITINGVSGFKFYEEDYCIFVPATGVKLSDSHFSQANFMGNYWSSTQNNDNSTYLLNFSPHHIMTTYSSNDASFSTVRCVSTEETKPEKNACEKMEELILANTTSAKLIEGTYIFDEMCLDLDEYGRTFKSDLKNTSNFTVDNNGLAAPQDWVVEAAKQTAAFFKKAFVKFENGRYYANAVWCNEKVTPAFCYPNTLELCPCGHRYEQKGDVITIYWNEGAMDGTAEIITLYYRKGVLWNNSTGENDGVITLKKKE